MFLLVPAHPGSPGQIGRRTVVLLLLFIRFSKKYLLAQSAEIKSLCAYRAV